MKAKAGRRKGKVAEKPRTRAPKRYKDPSALEAACFLCVYLPLTLVAWQVLAVGRMLRTRGSLKPLSGRKGALKPHVYVRFTIRDIKIDKNGHADGFSSGFGQFPSIPAALRAYKHQNRSPVAVLRSRFLMNAPYSWARLPPVSSGGSLGLVTSPEVQFV